MTYSRYFAIKSGSDPSVTRTLPGATDVVFILLGRERGGLCAELQAAVPSRYPDKRGIRVGDYVLAGYDSSTNNQWFHGYVTSMRHSPASNLIEITAKGFEEQLKNIKPRVNYGADPNNPYIVYDNEAKTGVAGGTDSVVYDLWNTYIKGNEDTIQGVNSSATIQQDTSGASTDIEYLVYDGSTSLYDIFTALAERTGFSWGFLPTASAMEDHTFFFKDVDASFTPQFSKFIYGGDNPSCISIETNQDEEQYINDLDIVGADVPRIGESISRNYVDEEQATKPLNHITRSVPGYRTTNDITIHAKAVLNRRRDPGDAYNVTLLQRDVTQTNMGPCFYAGRTIIKVADAFGGFFNDDSTKYTANEIRVRMIGHAIQMEMVLGERPDSTSSILKGGIQKNRPALSFTYDGATVDPVNSWPGVENRVQNIRLGGTITAKHATEDKATVRVTDAGASNPEVYTDIPLPTGTVLADWDINDQIDVVQRYVDQELNSVTTEQFGLTAGTSVDADKVLDLMRLYMANGLVAVTNKTPFLDVNADGGSFAEGDATLVPGAGTYAESPFGLAMRCPQDNILALNTLIHAIASAAYDTTGLTLPGTPAQAKLFGTIMDITSSGQVGLGGSISGTDIIVIVKTGLATIRNMYLAEGTDPPTLETVAAPRGTFTRSNSA